MEVVNNDLVFGSSGRIGDMLVFKQRGGKTYISKRPKPKSVPDSEDQVKVKERFLEASLYATAVIKDESRKAVYQAKATALKSAYNLAFSDFFKAPEIKKEDVSGYTGQPGGLIVVRAIDDFKVVSVSVVIKDSGNAMIEEGAAVLAPNGLDWIYTATEENPSIAGTKIIISASDLAGNITSKEVEL